MSDLTQDLAALKLEREPVTPANRRWVGWLVLVLLVAAAGGTAWWWFSRERPIAVEIASVTQRRAVDRKSVV